MRKRFKILLVVLAVIIILIAAALSILSFDLLSYTATGKQTLYPSGASFGTALVVYDPGASGAAKADATKIAIDLQVKGYIVVLAGVHSGAANDKSGYNIVVAGGPLYFGKLTSSVDNFIKTLPANVKLGVFASTGSSSLVQSDLNSLQNEVTAYNSDATVKLILDGNEAGNCADLVNTLTA